MDQSQLNVFTNFIWNIADDVSRTDGWYLTSAGTNTGWWFGLTMTITRSASDSWERTTNTTKLAHRMCE
jgi:hypothetical protein